MSASHVLALDFGTTHLRVLVMDEAARVLGRAVRRVETRYPAAARVEQDPAGVLEQAGDAMREALSVAGVEAGEVAALGIASQRSTAVAWDARDRRALAPMIGWQDRRTLPRVEALREAGVAIDTLPSATKFEWWLENEPAVQRAAEQGYLRLGTPDVWLTAGLCADEVHVTEPGHAACTGLYHPRKEAWDPRALALFGLERDWLPEVVASDALVGELAPRLLGTSIPLAARLGDQQAAAFAQGIGEGEAKLTLGTSAMLNRHTGESLERPRAGVYPLPLWRLEDGSRAHCLEATVVTAGAAIDWLVDLGVLESPAALDREASRGAGDLLFVPALQGLGSPYLDDAARGLLGGLTRGSQRADIVRAVAAGVANRCAELCAVCEVSGRVVVDGGLARSDWVLQAIADASGLALERREETETTAIGAGLLAGGAVGVYQPGARPNAVLGAVRRFEPRVDATERERVRQRYLRGVERVLER